MNNCDNLVEALRKHKSDYDEGRTQNFYNVCSDCKAAADVIDSLTAELYEEIDRISRLRLRLEHLLLSETIRDYDERDSATGTYARDIRMLDKRMHYLEELKKKYYEIAPFVQGEVVYNTNNNSRGVVIEEMKDKAAVRILEVNSKVGVFINCPPRIALKRTGETIDFKQLIMEREG